MYLPSLFSVCIIQQSGRYVPFKLAYLTGANSYFLSLGLGITGTSSTIDPTSWNVVAKAVNCGTGKTLLSVVKNNSDVNRGTVVTDAAQLACMKAVDFRTLEDAVISTGVVLNPVADSKSC